MSRDLDRDLPDRAAPWERTREVTHERPATERRDRPERRAVSVPLAEHDQRLLMEVARFRTVAEKDLVQGFSANHPDALKGIRSLAQRGFLQRRRAQIGPQRQALDVVVLTKPGLRRLREAVGPASNQSFYAGFVKPSEVAHDAAIYPMYRMEAGRLEQEGSRITRLVLDYELKRLVYSPLNKLRGVSERERVRRQHNVAAQYGLKVIRGHIVLPDLRIEYETRDGQQARVDLELATGHYHGAHMRDKAEAGFRIYVADGSEKRLTRVMEEREIIAAILSI